MADSPQSDASHESTEGRNSAHTAKASTVKDKQCPYCSQAFTSSSLGRHLDQYLHKKKPDGVHNVKEIRQLRGGITRRTARHSKTHDHEEGPVASDSPAAPQASTPLIDTLNAVPRGGLDARFNAPHWHSTGVISDFSTLHSASPSTPSAVTSLKRPYSSLATPVNTESETARALELSLREVLDSLRAATTRAHPRSSPFDFDLQSETFPSLCLKLLPIPPTLFSASPFPTSTSCSLSSPLRPQREVLGLNLSTKIQRWKWDSLRHAQHRTYPTESSNNLGEEADHLSRTATQYEELASKHLDLAFTTWMSYPADVRQNMWQIELLRAYSNERKKTRDLEDQLERVMVECCRLEGQVEHLSRCQWPREMALWPPERTPFTKDEVNEIRSINLNLRNGTNVGGNDVGDHSDRRTSPSSERWDFDRLLNKWKKHVREDKSRRTGVAVQNAQSHPPHAPTLLAGAATPVNLAQHQLDDLRLHMSSLPKKPRMEVDGAGTRKPSVVENGVVNGNANGTLSEARRKSLRKQQQQQQLETGLAGQTEELSDFTQALQDLRR